MIDQPKTFTLQTRQLREVRRTQMPLLSYPDAKLGFLWAWLDAAGIQASLAYIQTLQPDGLRYPTHEPTEILYAGDCIVVLVADGVNVEAIKFPNVTADFATVIFATPEEMPASPDKVFNLSGNLNVTDLANLHEQVEAEVYVDTLVSNQVVYDDLPVAPDTTYQNVFMAPNICVDPNTIFLDRDDMLT